MVFLRRFLTGYRLPFARFDQRAYGSPQAAGSGCMGLLLRNPRVLMGLLIAVGYFFYYQFGTTEYQNEFTGRVQKLALPTAEEEVAMGLASRAPLIRQFGGEHPDPKAQALVDKIGERLVNSTAARRTPYQFEFHLLNDSQTINAFALPGGQIFITYALLSQLKNEDQVAGVLGHEIGHVVGRHSNQQMAKSKLIQGMAQGVGVAMSDGTGNGGIQIAQMLGNIINMKYGREDELESDALGVRFMIEAGYNPEEMIGVMEVLKKGGGGRQAEMLSTHPDPGNRIEHIKAEIAKYRSQR